VTQDMTPAQERAQWRQERAQWRVRRALRERRAAIDGSAVAFQALHDIRGLLGFDNDGELTPHAQIAGAGSAARYVEQVLADVREYLTDREESEAQDRAELEQITDQAEARGIEAHAAGDFIVTLTEDLDSARAELSKRDSSIKRLRTELARRDEQITAVRALAEGLATPTDWDRRSNQQFSNALIAALDGGAS
jgi:hypothetical protein